MGRLCTTECTHLPTSDIRCFLCFNLHVNSQTVDFDTWQMTHCACANLLLLCCPGLWVHLKHPSLKNVLHCCIGEEMVWQRNSKGLFRGKKRGTASDTLGTRIFVSQSMSQTVHATKQPE